MAVCSLPAPVRVRSLLPDCGKLTLRVHGRGHEPRLVRIQAAKCTVGSAAGCTLRLRSAGVAPLACWILRGKCGAVVRRMHGAATLNGGALEEAPLQAGDRLRIGAVELEVVECRESQPESFSEPFPQLAPSVLTAEL